MDFMADSYRVEYRCPRFHRLFGVAILASQEQPGVAEFACQRCKQAANRKGLSPTARVIHRFSLGGVCVATFDVPGDGVG